MTREQAEAVAEFIQLRLDASKVWSISIGETRQVDPSKPRKWRVVIECAGSYLPIAIYSARVLTKPLAEVI